LFSDKDLEARVECNGRKAAMEEAVMGYEVEVVDLVGFCRVINCTKATVINAELNMCRLIL